MTGDSCGICGAHPAESSWVRIRPAGEPASACVDCRPRIARSAEDRGGTREDFSRMADLYVSIGGEIWESDGIDFWFRTPLRFRPAPPRPPIVIATKLARQERKAVPLIRIGLLRRVFSRR